MADYGVVAEGFVAKDLETILAELEDDQRDLLAGDINTQADSVLGQLNGIIGAKLDELWTVLLAIYRARQPSSAEGEALDNVGAITDAFRLGTKPSTATVLLNLDAATTVLVDSLVAIGPAGEQWTVDAEVTNGGSDQANVEAQISSVNDGPIVGNAHSIDSIISPISGWTAKAAVDSQNTEPFALADLETLLIEVDDGISQAVTFNTADFISIGAATAQEVIDAIEADTTGLSGIDASGVVRIVSDLDGSGSAIKVIGGTGIEALGFTQAIHKGFNNPTPARLINTLSEPYDMTGSPTLFLSMDDGTTQTVNFVDGDFSTPAAATAIEVAKAINAAIVDGYGYEVVSKVQLESLTTGVNSVVEVTGGTANTELGFPLSDAQGGLGADAVLGRDVETDPAYRIRRVQLLRLTGKGTFEAMRAALLNETNVPGVLQAFVFENTTNIVDAFGRPAKSFEAVMVGGDSVDICNTIFATKPLGIESYKVAGPNGFTETVTDSQGTDHDINYSIADEVELHTVVDVNVVSGIFGGGSQVNGEQEIREAIKDYADSTLLIGDGITILRYKCIPLEIAGVDDVTDIYIDTLAVPVNQANIPGTQRELFTFSTANIDINVTFI
ncbi:hypothetical protein K0U83_05615 [bacterium]|nr:hypothetical protein [bacterium]